MYEIESDEETELTVPDDKALPQTAGAVTPPTDGDDTHCGRARAVTRVVNGSIAQLGNEVFLFDRGRWHKQTGHVRRAMLRWWGSNPRKTGQWDAALQEWAVDPNDDAAAVFYERLPGEDWEPAAVSVREVCFADGRYNIVTRKFTPRELGRLTFGPVLHHCFDAQILEACRKRDWSTAPAQFVELLQMVDFALGGDQATVDYFQAIVGQILRPHAGFNHFVHVFGESGARKTTIMRTLLSAPCGPTGFNEISEALLAEHKFMRAGLINRIANLSNDSAVTSKFVPFIKEITSGVLVTEKKYHDPCGVRLTAKLFATMNIPQRYDDDSLGIENRLIVFKFLPRNDNNRSAAGMQWMDTAFYDDLTRAWITHWLLAGLERCVADGQEVEPLPSETARKWKDALLNNAMPVRRFVQEHVKIDEQAFAPTNKLVDVAIESGFCAADERSRVNFAERLTSFILHRFGIERRRRIFEGKRVTGFSGLALIDTE